VYPGVKLDLLHPLLIFLALSITVVCLTGELLPSLEVLLNGSGGDEFFFIGTD